DRAPPRRGGGELVHRGRVPRDQAGRGPLPVADRSRGRGQASPRAAAPAAGPAAGGAGLPAPGPPAVRRGQGVLPGVLRVGLGGGRGRQTIRSSRPRGHVAVPGPRTHSAPAAAERVVRRQTTETSSCDALPGESWC